MHAVLHTLPAVYFWGAVDNAALALQESDHIPYVKDAVKRTRRHEQTYQDEVLLAAARDRPPYQTTCKCIPVVSQHGLNQTQ